MFARSRLHLRFALLAFVVATMPAAVLARNSTEPPVPAWAVAGVPVQTFATPGFASDPRKAPGFQEGGVYSELVSEKLDRLSPWTKEAPVRRIISLVFESLASYDPQTLELRGQIADGWQIDPAGRWLRVHLNPAAKWSDGQPVTAADVVFSHQENMKMAGSSPEQFGASETDESTVMFTFAKPRYANVKDVLTNYILPKRLYQPLTRNEKEKNEATGFVVGSGPFVLVGGDSLATQWKPGQPIILKRNPNAWSIRPPLDEMRFIVEKGDEILRRRFVSEPIDALIPSAELFDALSKDESFVAKTNIITYVNFACNWQGILWNCGERDGKPTPFVDPKVRRAMTMIIDREMIISKVFSGVGFPISGPGSPNRAAYDRSIEPLPVDPAAAAALLTQAGWIDRDKDGQREDAQGRPFEFTFVYPPSPASLGVLAGEIVRQCASVGIVCNAKSDASFAATRQSRAFDALIFGLSPRDPEGDPEVYWHQDKANENGSNFANWKSGPASDIIDKAGVEFDTAKRNELWHRLHRVIAEEQPCTFIRVSPARFFVKKTIGNVVEHPVGLLRAEFFRTDAK